MFEKKAKYLEFIQTIINRMAECSFKCKEFCILICSALLAVYGAVCPHPHILLILCDVPIMLFWLLDAFYLKQEKGFRNTYNNKAILNDEKDFSDFRIKPNNENNSYCTSLFSKTILPLYLSLFLLATISGLILIVINK